MIRPPPRSTRPDTLFPTRRSSDLSTKLMLTLRDKPKYVLHYRLLKLYVQLGLQVTKIHRVMRFRQYPFMKEFILHNTALRAKATSDFEKDLYKLMRSEEHKSELQSLMRLTYAVFCLKKKTH